MNNYNETNTEVFTDFLLYHVFNRLLKEEGLYSILQFSLICQRSYARIKPLKLSDGGCKHRSCQTSDRCIMSVVINCHELSVFPPNFKGYDYNKLEKYRANRWSISYWMYRYPVFYSLLLDHKHDLYERLTQMEEYMTGLNAIISDDFAIYILTSALTNEKYIIKKVAPLVKSLMRRIFYLVVLLFGHFIALNLSGIYLI